MAPHLVDVLLPEFVGEQPVPAELQFLGEDVDGADRMAEDAVGQVHLVDVEVEGVHLVLRHGVTPHRVLGPIVLPGFEDEDGAFLRGESRSQSGETLVDARGG